MEIGWNSMAAIAAALMMILFAVLWLWQRRRLPPSYRYSGFFSASAVRSWRVRLAILPPLFYFFALFLFLLAFLDFHDFSLKHHDERKQPPAPMEGIAIYLVLDKSGSMHQKVVAKDRFGIERSRSKMELLKEVTLKFLEGDQQLGLPGRPDDLIGVIGFARGADVLTPLTLDHRQVRKELQKLSYSQDPDEVGTSIGYAIYKTVNLIASTRLYGQQMVKEGLPAYEIKSAAIVLVTDGFQEIHPEDVDNPRRNFDLFAAAEYAQKEDIRLYIVNIDPRFKKAELAPYRDLFKIVTTLTDGRFFMADNIEELAKVYAEIDQLEKQSLPSGLIADKEMLPNLYKRRSPATLLIAGGLAALFFSILLETVVLRRVL